MAERDIRRNTYKQIISNKLNTDEFSGFKNKLLNAGLTTFNLDDYNRVLDRLSDELINPIPDLTPRIVSSNFVDTELILSDFDLSVVDMNLHGAGTYGLWFSDFSPTPPYQTLVTTTSRLKIFSNFMFSKDLPFVNVRHAMYPDNFSDSLESGVYYRVSEGKLGVGTQLYKQGTTDEPLDPPYDTSWYPIKSFDVNKDAQLDDGSGQNLTTYLTTANANLAQEIHDEFNALKNIQIIDPVGTVNAIKAFNDYGLGNYSGAPFTGGMVEVDLDGKVVSLWVFVNTYGYDANNFIDINQVF